MRTIKKCRVAVVGGAGFLGSHLVNHLIDDRQCDVIVIDNLVVGKREFVHPKARFEHHDITGSEDRLRQLFEGCEYVFNYAAYPYIPISFARPIHVCDVNFLGALKVINAAQDAGAKAILQVSSAEIYGNCPIIDQQDPDEIDGGIDEQYPVTPHSSYGASKAAVDFWCQCAWKERKTPVIALRQFNCVGERETHPYIVPEIIGQLSRSNAPHWAKDGSLEVTTLPGEEVIEMDRPGIVKLGNNSFRDFLYAGDAVRMAKSLLERGQFGEVYNLGSESGIKMYDLAKKIGRLMGFADVTVEQDLARVRPWEIWSLCSDNTKIKSAMESTTEYVESEGVDVTYPDQMISSISLETALVLTIDDYRNRGCKWPWE